MSQNLSSAAVMIGALRVNSFLAISNCCRLLVTLANGLGPFQARQIVTGFKLFGTLIVFPTYFLNKDYLKERKKKKSTVQCCQVSLYESDSALLTQTNHS